MKVKNSPLSSSVISPKNDVGIVAGFVFPAYLHAILVPTSEFSGTCTLLYVYFAAVGASFSSKTVILIFTEAGVEAVQDVAVFPLQSVALTTKL